MVGICCFFCGASSCCVIAARGQTTNAANMATRMIGTKVMVRREFIVPLGFLDVQHIFPQEGGIAADSSRGFYCARPPSCGILSAPWDLGRLSYFPTVW